MPAPGVVQALDELKDGHAGLCLGPETGPVDQFTLQGGEEALTHGIVVAVAHGAHGGTHTGLTAPLTESQGGVLGTLIGMVHDLVRPPLTECHLQGIQDQLGSQMRGHGPPDDPAAAGIEHNGKEQEPRPGGDVRYVGHPQGIRFRGQEVPVHQVRCGTGALFANRCARPLAAAYPLQAFPLHEPGHTFSAHTVTLLGQILMNPGCPVGATASFVEGPDLLRQRRILSGSCRRSSGSPRIVSAGGDTPQAAHRGGMKLGLIRLHEFEDFLDLESVSRANQAVAFAKISRSSRNRRFSRRSLAISWRSAVVRPSLRPPSSRSACRTQFRMDCAVGSNSRESSSGVRPARTNSIICCLKSGEYGLRVRGIVDSSFPKGEVSTKPGQLQRCS